MENKETDILKDVDLSSEDPIVQQKFDFSGSAEIVKIESGKTRKINKEETLDFVSSLNEISNEIEAEIEKEVLSKVESLFPNSPQLKVEISFKQGSFLIEGIISFATFENIGRIADTLALISLLKDVSKYVIKKVVRKSIESRTNDETEFQVKSINVDVEEKRFRANFATRFFWWCAGAIVEELEKYPTEKAKYQGVGATILLTSVLACLSGSFAISIVLYPEQANIDTRGYALCGVFGLIWAIIIFNLDRFIVSSLKKELSNNDFNDYQNQDKKSSSGFSIVESIRISTKELGRAIPRIILATIIAITISKPLELAIFNTAIKNHISLSNTEKRQLKEEDLERNFKAKSSPLSGELEKLETEISNVNERIAKYQDELNRETQGISGSGKYGRGPAAIMIENQKKELQNTSDALKANPRINELKGLVMSFLNEKNKELKEFENSLNYPGLLEKITALSELGSNTPAIYWANWFIILLFWGIEVAPVISKILIPCGPYDAKINLTNDTIVNRLKSQRDFFIKINNDEYERRFKAETELNENFFEYVTRNRTGVLRNYIQQWNWSDLNNFETLFNRIKKTFFSKRDLM